MIAVDVRYGIEPFRARIAELVAEIATTGKAFHGPHVAEFEKAWAAYCGAKHCVCCGSGEAALEIAAYALGMRKVSVQANTIVCTVRGLLAGMKAAGHDGPDSLELLDVDPRCGTIIQDRLRFGKSLVPVMLYGQQAWTQRGGEVLFDACQAHGWQHPDYADAVCWSFYATKNLGGITDGGAVTFNGDDDCSYDEYIYLRADDYARNIGARGRMNELNAGLLLAKLPHLTMWNRERREVGMKYWHKLNCSHPFVLPLHPAHSNCHLFPVLVSNAKSVQERMHNRGVECGRHYHSPVHMLLDHRRSDLEVEADEYPGAAQWCSKVLTLPCYPGMPDEDIDRVVEALVESTKA